MTHLDYAAVRRYWNAARPSVLGPYMMDGFGFPAGAGEFRFQAEIRIASRLIHTVVRQGTVLDLGAGIGYWAEYFAQHFAKVVAVESSGPLYESLKQRAGAYENLKPIQQDVLTFQPQDRYNLIFLGGLLMYLNEADVLALLHKLRPLLNPQGVILCRETTVREGTLTREGEYQAVYRCVSAYEHIFQQCGLTVVNARINAPYLLIQMGCEFIKKWKAVVPAHIQMLPVVGHLTYWGLRAGYPWITRLPGALRCKFPQLTNHFFVLRAGTGDRQESN